MLTFSAVLHVEVLLIYSNTCVKQPLSKRQKIGFQDSLSHYAGQNITEKEHSGILSTFIKLSFVVKTFVLSILEWPFYIGFTVYPYFVYTSSKGSLASLARLSFGF